MTQPVHVAIIMDGNGRWAKQRGKGRTFGHYEGMKAVRRAVEAANHLGLQYLTLFGFSSENWRRPADEVHDLMGLLRRYLQSEIAELHSKNIRVHIIGDKTRFSQDLQHLMTQSESVTGQNTGLTLVLALNYGGKADIVQAAQRLAIDVAEGRRSAGDINEALLSTYLLTHTLPDPDVIIRTSGEQRLSNFLLWQGAYSEMVFLDVLWPDFDQTHLIAAITEFYKRERRFGAVNSV
jgi:undecaprenyl diphosphate synthase